MTRPRNYLDYLNPTTAKMWRCGLGNDYDFKRETMFALNPDIDSNTVPELVWGQGGNLALVSAAGAVSVVSASANDAAAGTGARTIRVTGLDASYFEVSETVTLNGTTPVSLTATMLRINRVEVLTAGSGEVNAGAITASIGATVVTSIPAGAGICQTALFTVPADYDKALLVNIFVSVSSNSAASGVVNLVKRSSSGVRQTIVSYALDTYGNNFVERNLMEAPIVLEPKTDLWAIVTSATANKVAVAANWKLLLVKKSPE